MRASLREPLIDSIVGLAGRYSKLYSGSAGGRPAPLLLDMMDLVFRANISLAPAVSRSSGIILSNTELLAGYAIGRHLLGQSARQVDIIGDMATGWLELAPSKALDPATYGKLVKAYSVLVKLPASPEPGLNRASLPAYVTLSSALMWANRHDPEDLLGVYSWALRYALGEEGYGELLDRLRSAWREAALELSWPGTEGELMGMMRAKEDPCVERFRDGYRDGEEAEYLECSERAAASPGAVVPGIIYYVNFHSISGFMSSFSRLRLYAASSTLVDALVTMAPLEALSRALKSTAPLQSLLIFAGGHSYLASRQASDDIEGDLARFREELDGITSRYLVKLEVGAGPLQWALEGRVGDVVVDAKARSLLEPRPRALSYGMHRTCEVCGVYPASREVDGVAMCSRCAGAHELANRFKVSKKSASDYVLAASGKDLRSQAGGELEDPMAYLGGGDYVSVVKFDGNNMGKFFTGQGGSAFYMTGYMTKSYLVDYSIKLAYSKAVSCIADLNEGAAHRTVAGTMFLGGDEGVVFMPPQYAPLFALKMIEAVKEEAPAVNLKFGILTVPVTSPAHLSVESAERVMESSKIEADGGSISSVGIYTSPESVTPESVEGFIKQSSRSGVMYYSPKVSYEELSGVLKAYSGGKMVLDAKSAKGLINGLLEDLSWLTISPRGPFGGRGEPGKRAIALYAIRQAGSKAGMGSLLGAVLSGYGKGVLNVYYYEFLFKAFVYGGDLK